MPPDPIVIESQERRLDADQQRRRDAHVQTVKDFQAKSVEAAKALAAIKDDGLFVEDGNFSDFARKHFGIAKTHAYDLAKAGRLYRELEGAGVEPLPTSEAQLRPLTKLKSFEEQRDAWERAVGAADEGGAESVTMEDVLTVVRERLGEADLTVAEREEATAEELRSLAPDELEAGRMLRRVFEGIRARAGTGEKAAARAFERFVRDDVGRSPTWAERALAYAEACDDLEEGRRPTAADFERHAPTLRPLAPEDQRAVWERLAEGPQRSKGHSPQAVADAVRDVVEEQLAELGLDPIAEPPAIDALVDALLVEDTAEASAAPHPIGLLIDVALLGDGGLRERVEAAGERVAPDTVRLAYNALDESDRAAAIDAVVEGMRARRDMPSGHGVDPDDATDPNDATDGPDGLTEEQSRLVDGQRKMVRVGFEPDLATWAWPVLTPAALRFPRAWLPDEGTLPTDTEPGSATPCFVPRRLLQPTRTRRKRLNAERRAEREAGTYLVNDDERHQSRVVLLAPGVDLTHPAVPDAVVRRVLDHAAEATEFVFLAVALDVDRLRGIDWPPNVRPVALASTPAVAARAVAAFAGADAEGVLVLRDAEEPLAVADPSEGKDLAKEHLAKEHLVREHVEGHLAAVLVRGEGTTAGALQSALALRRYGARVQVGRDVTVHEVEPVFDPAAFDTPRTKPAPSPRRTSPSGGTVRMPPFA